ncbi:MAG: glycerophosphodiester phosphodiesterase family protein [Candidatus Rokubacteria bacterium]|nr:glycerophosphodiester phosphodiesterase family protein [Candidatus Rokubacteria bacterium]
MVREGPHRERAVSAGAILAAALGLGLLVALGGSAGARAVGTLLAAHRGGAQLWPENSLLAFRNAIALGADFLEFDVHLSKDGEVVVIHDPTLDRTTTGSGAVKGRTIAELKALRLKDRAGAVTERSWWGSPLRLRSGSCWRSRWTRSASGIWASKKRSSASSTVTGCPAGRS